MNFSTIQYDDALAGNPDNIDYCLKYMELYHTTKAIKAVTPFSFFLGSGANMDTKLLNNNSLFWGKVILDINPNGSTLVDTKIVLELGSMFSSNYLHSSETKKITRTIERENFVNESSERHEFFDSCELTSLSTAYDVYVTFIGFKIDF